MEIGDFLVAPLDGRTSPNMYVEIGDEVSRTACAWARIRTRASNLTAMSLSRDKRTFLEL